MQVLLLRHGIAEDGEPDAARPLSLAGRRRTQAVLQRLVALELRCERLVSSPLLRARQTAELAVEAGLAADLTLAAALAPGAAARPWLELQRGVERLGLVGHEPDLSALAAGLIGAPPGSLQLKKAGVILLNWWPETGSATLQGLLTPKVLLG